MQSNSSRHNEFRALGVNKNQIAGWSLEVSIALIFTPELDQGYIEIYLRKFGN